jgi:hypothetical protein
MSRLPALHPGSLSTRRATDSLLTSESDDRFVRDGLASPVVTARMATIALLLRRYRRFGRVAQLLGVSRSTARCTVETLERKLRVRLFERQYALWTAIADREAWERLEELAAWSAATTTMFCRIRKMQSTSSIIASTPLGRANDRFFRAHRPRALAFAQPRHSATASVRDLASARHRPSTPAPSAPVASA